jgi:hypothetical protein
MTIRSPGLPLAYSATTGVSCSARDRSRVRSQGERTTDEALNSDPMERRQCIESERFRSPRPPDLESA